MYYRSVAMQERDILSQAINATAAEEARCYPHLLTSPICLTDHPCVQFFFLLFILDKAATWSAFQVSKLWWWSLSGPVSGQPSFCRGRLPEFRRWSPAEPAPWHRAVFSPHLGSSGQRGQHWERRGREEWTSRQQPMSGHRAHPEAALPRHGVHRGPGELMRRRVVGGGAERAEGFRGMGRRSSAQSDAEWRRMSTHDIYTITHLQEDKLRLRRKTACIYRTDWHRCHSSFPSCFSILPSLLHSSCAGLVLRPSLTPISISCRRTHSRNIQYMHTNTPPGPYFYDSDTETKVTHPTFITVTQVVLKRVAAC